MQIDYNLPTPEQHKFLIILPYFNRPKMVVNALKSIVASDANYKNWELAFLDDSSQTPGIPIAETVLHDVLDSRVKLHHSNLTPQQKLEGRGILGKFMNEFIRNSDADVAIMLSDDDALHPYYFKNLNIWLTAMPEVTSCYSEIFPFNPLTTTYEEALVALNNPAGVATLEFTKFPKLNGCRRIDSSQAAWRTSCNKDAGVWFNEHVTKNHDAYFYHGLYTQCGPMPFTGLMAQFKGRHRFQLMRQYYDRVVKHRVHIDK